MLSPFRSLAIGAFAVAGLASAASAQVFTDGFDIYPLGPLEGNQNPSGAVWHGWGGITTFISQVTTVQASSAPNSVALPFGCDTVVDFDDMTGGNPMVDTGQWRMTVEVFVDGVFDGRTYYIVMNEYSDPGPFEWAIQVALDATGPSPNVVCDCGTAGTLTTGLTPDTWVELKWEIDLDADWVDFYVGGTLLGGYTWSGGVFGGDNYATLSVNAIDLYPEFPATVGEVYIDNLLIVDTSAGPPGTQYCPGSGVAPATPCPCANNNDGSMGGCDWGDVMFPSGGVLDATGTASMGANDLNLVATSIENNFGIFFGANNAVNSGNGNVLNDGLRCAGGALVRLIPPTMASGNTATTPAPVQTLDTGAAAGATRRYQYWFRTPGGPCGQMANLTNGFEVNWLP